MSKIIKPNRRGFITGLASLIVAPAIVRVESIMPVKVINEQLTYEEVVEAAVKFSGKLFKITAVNSDKFYLEPESKITLVKPYDGFKVGDIITFKGY